MTTRAQLQAAVDHFRAIDADPDFQTYELPNFDADDMVTYEANRTLVALAERVLSAPTMTTNLCPDPPYSITVAMVQLDEGK